MYGAIAGGLMGLFSKGLSKDKRMQRRERRQERRAQRRGDNQTAVDPVELGRETAISGRLQGMSGAADYDYQQSREAQSDALGLTQAAAMGQAPSEAQLLAAQQGQQNVANQMSMAAQGRGGNMASMARQASMAGAAGQMGTMQQVSQLRAQEMAQARQMYADQSNTMAGMSLQQQAMLEQQLLAAQQGQLGADMGQRGLNLQQVNDNRNFGLGIANQGVRAGEAAAKMAGQFG